MSELKVNDGKGLFDKYGMFEEILTKIDLIADSKGALRCGLIWDVAGMIKALKKGIKEEESNYISKIEELKSQLGEIAE